MPPTSRRFCVWLFVIGGLLCGSASVFAAVSTLPVSGFTFSHDIVLPGKPNDIYDGFTGDISAWWDHSYSEHPKKIYIDPRPGGGFYEIFDDAGNGALHATVITADRGKLLRLDGPLGLAGRAVNMVHTLEFSARGADSTELKLTVNATGQIEEGLAGMVEQIWWHFLAERFKPYVESGKYLRKDKK